MINSISRKNIFSAYFLKLTYSLTRPISYTVYKVNKRSNVSPETRNNAFAS